MWPWVMTYASILGRMKSHVPPILMFTRGVRGFDPQPCSSEGVLPPPSGLLCALELPQGIFRGEQPTESGTKTRNRVYPYQYISIFYIYIYIHIKTIICNKHLTREIQIRYLSVVHLSTLFK